MTFWQKHPHWKSTRSHSSYAAVVAISPCFDCDTMPYAGQCIFCYMLSNDINYILYSSITTWRHSLFCECVGVFGVQDSVVHFHLLYWSSSLFSVSFTEHLADKVYRLNGWPRCNTAGRSHPIILSLFFLFIKEINQWTVFSLLSF